MTSSLANLGWKNGILTLIGRTTRSTSHRPNSNKPFRSRNLKKQQPSRNARHPQLQDMTLPLQKTSRCPLENNASSTPASPWSSQKDIMDNYTLEAAPPRLNSQWKEELSILTTEDLSRSS